ncbi:MAG: hypothetical protein DHS80DRAFT_13422 [Piptocephalis tieghemiana]|nr:MAG: hypothetical protein DHS80DRAFT_13422 [Piptocephalis tieghemiana]
MAHTLVTYLVSRPRYSTAPSSTQVVRVPGRGVIGLTGPDATKFLQGLMANNVEPVGSGDIPGTYGAFLTPQGRVDREAFVFHYHPDRLGDGPKEPGFLLDLPQDGVVPIMALLTKYRLRSKITIQDLSSAFTIWSRWSTISNDPAPPSSLQTPYLSLVDPRAPDMGHRLLLPSSPESPWAEGKEEEVCGSAYVIRRILRGVCEGPMDIWSGTSLPFDVNMDYAHAVDYRKGCYVGQELVSRTYHTGVIRKRMVPVQLIPLSSDHGSYDPTKPPILDPSIQLVFPPPQTDIRKMTSRPGKTRSAGRWAGGIHNIGLALLRLEDIRERQPLTLTMVDGQDMLLSPYIPSWWPISKDLSPSSSLSESKRS